MEVKAVSYRYKGHRNHYLTLDDANTMLYAYCQKSHKSNTTHYISFQALVEVVEHHGGSLCRDCALMLIELKNIDNDKVLDDLKVDELTELESIIRDKALAITLIKRSDKVRYSTLLDSLENQFSLGID